MRIKQKSLWKILSALLIGAALVFPRTWADEPRITDNYPRLIGGARDIVITSYSIHYTKLYEGKGIGLRLGVKTSGCSGMAYVLDVITSYSIHYTKLYEDCVCIPFKTNTSSCS